MGELNAGLEGEYDGLVGVKAGDTAKDGDCKTVSRGLYILGLNHDLLPD